MITFNSETHTYWNDDNIQYISTTTFIGELYPFDKNKVINNIITNKNSVYYGKSYDYVVELWDNISKEGTELHNSIENYIKHNKIPNILTHKPLVDQFSKLNFKGKLLAEKLIWHDKYRLAGTADILEVLDDCIYVYDIKTSNRLDDDKHLKFSLQLEIYKRMVEYVFNMPCKIGYILLFENFYERRQNTKMKLIKPLNVSKYVDVHLNKRLIDLQKENHNGK